MESKFRWDHFLFGALIVMFMLDIILAVASRNYHSAVGWTLALLWYWDPRKPLSD